MANIPINMPTAGVGMDPLVTASLISGGASILGGLFGSKQRTPSPQAQPLDPSLYNFGGQMAGLGQGALGDLSQYLGDGYGGALGQYYNTLQSAFGPQMQEQALDYENRLFQQGLLGRKGGLQPTLAEYQTSQDQQLQQQAIQGVNQRMTLLGQLGEGMFGALAPYKGMTDAATLDLSKGGLSDEFKAAALATEETKQQEYARLYQDMMLQQQREDEMAGGE